LLCNNDSKQAKYMYIPSSDNTKSLDTPKLYCLKCYFSFSLIKILCLIKIKLIKY
jgi:hypothetical protein